METTEAWWHAPCAAVVLRLSGRAEPGDGEALSRLVDRAVTEQHAVLVLCHVGAVEPPPDILLVGALAEAQLMAQRLGRRLHLQASGAQLRQLLSLAGLDEVLPCCPGVRRCENPRRAEPSVVRRDL